MTETAEGENSIFWTTQTPGVMIRIGKVGEELAFSKPVKVGVWEEKTIIVLPNEEVTITLPDGNRLHAERGGELYEKGAKELSRETVDRLLKDLENGN